MVRSGIRVNLCLLALVAVLAATACDAGHSGSPQSDALPDSQQVLRVAQMAYGSGQQILDPALGLDGTSATLQPFVLLYSGLVTLDGDLRPALWDADALHVSPDGLTYTFHLRPGLRFADGTPITSQDFAYSLNRALSPCLIATGYKGTAPFRHSDLAAYLFDLKGASAFANRAYAKCAADGTVIGFYSPAPDTRTTLIGEAISAPDATTLVLMLDHPDAAFLAQLAFPASYVVERRVLDRYGANWTNHLSDNGGQGTSGMYVVRSFTTDDHTGTATRLVLERSPRYWGDSPKLSVVDFAFTGTEEAAAAAFRSGQADLLPDICTAQANDAACHQIPGLGMQYLSVRADRPPLDDLRVRQAIALALDKTRLTSEYRVPGSPTNSIVPFGIAGYAPRITAALGETSPTGNARKARALWDAYVADKCGGQVSTCPTITLAHILHNQSLTVDEMARTSIEAALPGARVIYNDWYAHVLDEALPPVCRYPAGLAFFQGPASGQDPYLNWATDYADPSAWLSFVAQDNYQAGGGACTRDDNAERLLSQARGTEDEAARLQLYGEAEQSLIEDVAVIPIAQEYATYELRPSVRDYPATSWHWVSPLSWPAIYLARH